MDQPLFLAPMGKPRDYVNHPSLGVPGEPECIGPAIVDGYASVANFHKSQAHALHVAEAQLIRPSLPPESRVSDLRRRAKHSHVDLSHETHIIDREIIKARLAGRELKPRFVERLTALEALLDGVELAA